MGSHGSHRSHDFLLWVGNLTDGSVRGLAHTDSTLLLGSHGFHRSHGIALWVGNLTDASVRGLARTDSALLLGSHRSHRSHSIALWVGNLTLRVGWLARIPLCFWAHTDLTDPTVLLCGWEISLCAWAGSHGFRFAFGLTQISQIPLFCGWEISLSVRGLVWTVGLHGARSHGFIFQTLRTNQTYRTYRTNWTFLKIIREICGICVRPRRDKCEAGDKITKNCVISGVF